MKPKDRIKASGLDMMVAYPPGPVVIDQEISAKIAALVIAPFAIKEFPGNDHTVAEECAADVFEWMMGCIMSRLERADD